MVTDDWEGAEKNMVWKWSMLSLAGSFTIISAVLSAIPTYFLSFFLLPRWVGKDIDSLKRKYLWNGVHREGKGFYIVNWKRVCKRKEFRGLGPSTSGVSIKPCPSSGDGDYFMTRVINVHHWFHIATDLAQDGGQIGVLIGYPHLLFWKEWRP